MKQAILLVSRQLLEEILPPPWAALHWWRMVMEQNPTSELVAEPFHRALKLPGNCRITGISADYAFNHDQIAFRIESPDFRETIEGGTLPEVDAMYSAKHEYEDKPDWVYFRHWYGEAAVAVHREYGPDGKEVEKILDTWAGHTYKGLPAHIEDAVPTPPNVAWVSGACWRCGGTTTRQLTDGTAECDECAGKGLL